MYADKKRKIQYMINIFVTMSILIKKKICNSDLYKPSILTLEEKWQTKAI